jgi:hypothetical protein
VKFNSLTYGINYRFMDVGDSTDFKARIDWFRENIGYNLASSIYSWEKGFFMATITGDLFIS